MGLGECPGAPANGAHQVIKIITRPLKYLAGRDADTKYIVYFNDCDVI